MPDLSISPIHPEWKSVVARILSKVTELAVFGFVYFYLNSQLTQLAKWQKLAELQIITQTAYLKAAIYYNVFFPFPFFLENKSPSICLSPLNVI